MESIHVNRLKFLGFLLIEGFDFPAVVVVVEG